MITWEVAIKSVQDLVGQQDLAVVGQLFQARLDQLGGLAAARALIVHVDDDLRRARLDQRRIIELDNPLLPPQTPLQRRELWYHP